MPSAEAVVLPDNVRPTHYDLTLTPNFDDFTFAGDVDITVRMEPGTTEIMLNCAEIDIQSASVSWTEGDEEHERPASGISYNADAETATIGIAGIPSDGLVGNQRLRMKFTGELNDKLRGFYRSQYTNPEGETAYLATTQFEATDARRALPCWDEPAVKATFQVTLNVPEEMAAVSNTPIIEEKAGDSPGVKTVKFDTTPIMSTYLLAFVIGDLTHIEKEAADGTVVGIWMTRGKEEQGQFALDTSVKLLSFFNDYFGIPYPLPKLDHLAIPDFAAGAMENWGCVTYRETALLVDPANSSAGTRQRVAEVVAHEMAHMWFGDLVTMEWWDDLWLNESFATWVGTKAVDWLFPEWSMWTQFVNMDTNRAFNLDGLKNSHPIEQEVLNPAEVSQLFDAISYSKGGSVLRMLEHFLTPSSFRIWTEHLSQPPLLRQRAHHRPLDRPGGVFGPAGEHDYEQLDRPDGLPGAGCGSHRYGWRPHVGSQAGTVRVRFRAGRRRGRGRRGTGLAGSVDRRRGWRRSYGNPGQRGDGYCRGGNPG